MRTMSQPAAGNGPDHSPVADLLREIMSTHLSGQAIGLDDDFYAMGGDSLTALQVVTDAQDRGILVTLRDLLYYPTARELAAALASPAAPDGSVAHRPPPAPFEFLRPVDRALVPADAQDAIPASHLQVGIIYLCEASGDPQLYVSLVGWTVSAQFDEPLFRAAFRDLCQRHVVLRSSFDLGNFSVPVQLIHPTQDPVLSVEWDPEDGARTTDQAVSLWQERPSTMSFGWNNPPLLRCHVVAAQQAFRVILAAHHAIIDGWSFGRLIVDLLTLYDARRRGEAAQLPPISPSGYREFIRTERELLASPQATAYWKAQADAPRLLFGADVPGNTANACASAGFAVPDRLAQNLRHAARELCVPLKSVALAAHAQALGAWCDREENLVTGVVMNTRPETAGPDLMVGLYLNTVPLRFKSLNVTWADLAIAAFNAEREASQYRAYPLAQIEADLGRPPFDAVFNFMNFHVYEGVNLLPEITAESWQIAGKPSFPFRVDFSVAGPVAGGRVVIDYDPGLLAAERVDRYADHFRNALAAAAAEPDAIAAESCG